MLYFEQPFWSSALTGKDALRKRVQFALSELFVISSQDAIVGQMPRGVANYYDMLGNDAFTNYRQLLQDVTLSPMMGIYLSIWPMTRATPTAIRTRTTRVR